MDTSVGFSRSQENVSAGVSCIQVASATKDLKEERVVIKLGEAAPSFSFIHHIAFVFMDVLLLHQIAIPVMEETFVKSFLQKMKIPFLFPRCAKRMRHPPISFSFFPFDYWFADVFLPSFYLCCGVGS